MEKSYCAICTPYRAGGLTLKRPGRADSRHSTVRSPSTRTSADAASFEVAMAIDWKRVLSDIPI